MTNVFKDIPYVYMYTIFHNNELFSSKKNCGLEHLFLSFFHKAVLYRETAPMFPRFLFPLTQYIRTISYLGHLRRFRHSPIATLYKYFPQHLHALV